MRLDQSHLLSNIRKYLQNEKRETSFIESFYKNGNAKGYCQGFSNLWEIDPDWFLSVSEKISNYGNTELSDTDKIELDIFISNLQFYQNPSLYIAAGQGHLEKIDEIISGEIGFLRIITGKAVLVTPNANIIYNNLQQLFSKGKTISITLETDVLDKTGKNKHESHQVSARKNEDGSYTFYDPNNKKGEQIFSGESALEQMAEHISKWNQDSRKKFSIGLVAFNKVPHIQTESKISDKKTIHEVFYSPEEINQALTMAVRIDDKMMVEKLISEGADPNYIVNGITTPLLLSARSGQLECLSTQLEQASVENIENSLTGAARFGQLSACEILIKKLEELNLAIAPFQQAIGTALIAAAKGNHPLVVKELLKFKIPENYLAMALREAFKAESHICQKLLLEHGVSLNDFTYDVSGMTMLEEAIMSDNIDLAKRLLNLGAEPNTNDQAERLFESLEISENKNVPSLRSLLILSGAKISADKLPLAIQVALISGRNDILQSFLEGKPAANPNIADSKILTPLMIAIMKSNTGAVDMLLTAGADPNRSASPGKDNALTLTKNLLIEAKKTNNEDKLEKLTAIKIKLEEQLSKLHSKNPKPTEKVKPDLPKISRPSLVNAHVLIGNPKKNHQQIPNQERSQPSIT